MMPLISLADGLAHARQHRYALGAFNVLDTHFLRALFAAAKQERSPFIINIAEVHFKYGSWHQRSRRADRTLLARAPVSYPDRSENRRYASIPPSSAANP